MLSERTREDSCRVFRLLKETSTILERNKAIISNADPVSLDPDPVLCKISYGYGSRPYTFDKVPDLVPSENDTYPEPDLATKIAATKNIGCLLWLSILTEKDTA